MIRYTNNCSFKIFKVGGNLVPTRKKNGEIKLCVDFKNLNKCCLKDNYPLHKMDHILHNVVGSKIISMIDGYLDYNQVLVHRDDKDKMDFTTPWGTLCMIRFLLG